MLKRIFLSVIAAVAVSRAAEKPNIIVIMADDLGYGDVGCYGATKVKTPYIDQLAGEGVRFTSGYCSASTCTPTRYSLLTGRYAFRTKGTGIAPPNGPAIIKPGTETLPSLLQKAGYRTAVVGKWHLGLGGPTGPDWNGDLKPGPLEIGFDTAFLLPTTNDRVPQVYVRDRRVVNLDPKDPLWVGNKRPSEDHWTGKSHRHLLKMDWTHGHNSTIHNGISRIGFYTGGQKARFRDEDLADEWVKESVQFMVDNKDRPFFLFFSSHDIHVPRMPHERFQGKSEMSYRGDAIVEFDWCVGELIKAVDELKLAEKTLFVVCSDNGPVMDDGYADEALKTVGDHRAGGPFTGGKYSIYEGGTRTPFITRWKGKIKPGVSDEVVCTIDFASSFAAMTGVKVPKDECYDSFNVLGALLGKKGAKGRGHLVQQDNGNRGNWGFRVGKWKLQRHDRKSARNVVVEKLLANTPRPQYSLYDLSKDPGEKNNVMAKFPEVGNRLKKQLQELIDKGRSR